MSERLAEIIRVEMSKGAYQMLPDELPYESAARRVAAAVVAAQHDEATRLRLLASHWQEVVSAPSFEAAVTVAAHAYHEAECVYATELKRLRKGIAPEPIDPTEKGAL